MAKCKSKKCRCYKSSLAMQYENDDNCFDVCSNAPCGDPKYLTTLAPVIYDQVGINLCSTITAPTDITTTYPTAVRAVAKVVDIALPTTGTPGSIVTVTPISGRPNCYSVTLTNLTVSFAISVFDCCNRQLATFPATATYLPSDITAPTYDEDTNPSSVELELYAPYGISYADATLATPTISYVGFTTASNTVSQGLNVTAMAKVLNLDVPENTLTIGLSVYVHSIYFNAYKLCHDGKAKAPKANISTDEESLCMAFVDGDLLNMNIKPLELEPPKCEGCLKKECNTNPSDCDCEDADSCSYEKKCACSCENTATGSPSVTDVF